MEILSPVKLTRNFYSYLLCAIFLQWILMTGSDAATVTNPDTVPLSTIIAKLPLPHQGTLLLVDAEHTDSVPGSELNIKSLHSFVDAADAYGLIVRYFGDIIAVAPATRYEFNADFSAATPYGDLEPDMAFTYFCSLLDDRQWSLLVSRTGLGIDDLTTSDQLSLFQAMFPVRQVKVMPTFQPQLTGEQPPVPQELEIAQMKLRLSANIRVAFNVGDSEFKSSIYTVHPSKSYYLLNSPPQPHSLFGVPWRLLVPNNSQHNDLPLSEQNFSAKIAIDGIHTVGELINRISSKIKLELYASSYYDQRLVTFAGTNNSSTARDLLQALALDLCGTYRRVGPAYVLTDDILGIGPKQLLISTVQRAGKDSAQKQFLVAARELSKKRATTMLKAWDDPLAPSDNQMATLEGNIGLRSTHLEMSFNDLTSAQQQQLLWEASQDSLWSEPIPYPNDREKMAKQSVASLEITPFLQLITPSLDGPINNPIPGSPFPLESEDMSSLVNPGSWENVNIISDIPVHVNRTDWEKLIHQFHTRAAYVRLQDAASIPSLIAAAQSAGFNELWIDSYYDGQLRVTGSSSMAHADPGGDLLAAALIAAKKTGIKVYAVCHALRTTHAEHDSDLDLSLFGTHSVDSDRQWITKSFPNQTDSEMKNVQDGDYLSPFSQFVQENLKANLEKLTKYPELAGVVLRSIHPPGYNGEGNELRTDAPVQLGYTIASRLAFLREEHIDPVDIFIPGVLDVTSGNLSVDQDMQDTLYRKWSEFRQEGLKIITKSIDHMYGAKDSPANSISNVYVETETGYPFQSTFHNYRNPQSTQVKLDRSGDAGAMISSKQSKVSSLSEIRLMELSDQSLVGRVLNEMKLEGEAYDSAMVDARYNDLMQKQGLTLQSVFLAFSKVDNKQSDGIVLNLTPDGGMIDGVRQFVHLANTINAATNEPSDHAKVSP